MKKVIVDKSLCVRCGACMSLAKDVFGYGDDGESVPKIDMVDDNNKDAINAMEGCPTGAISLEPMNKEEDHSNCECENCNCGDDCKCE